MQNILIVGAGNLSWHLSRVLQDAGYGVGLVSRQPARVADWPVRVLGVGDLAGEDCDLVVLAVPDHAIHPCSTALALHLRPRLPVVHTSGATPVALINSHFARRGALWPIRSLRAHEPVGDWRNLPLAYHADHPELLAELAALTGSLSDQTYALDDQQRARLHLAAVFSNNFVTWLYEISHQLCTESGIPFAALLPIIRNTALSQDGRSPALRQTGAAARGDEITLRRHLTLLADHPAYAELYATLSELIRRGTATEQGGAAAGL